MSEKINTAAGCTDDFDRESITPAAALDKIFRFVNAVERSEAVPVRESLNKVLAEDIHSRLNVPSARNSAMDGYAVRANDLPDDGIKTFKLIGTCLAGRPFKQAVGAGECVRITTGAVMPEGTDTVVLQEHVEADGNAIRLDNRTRGGANVRAAGEDLATGDLVLKKGVRLTPAELGLLASLGFAEVSVFKNIKVAFFSTGDELRSVGEPLEDGAIYDSNRYTLYGMLSRLGVEIIDMGVVRDDRDLLEQAFKAATEQADVLISSGGVSVGEADYIKAILERLGEINFWKVAMKPGRPLTLGRINDTCFFGLPGNPVSVMVTFYQFVQPALKKLMGETLCAPIMLTVPCTSKLRKRPGRVEYQRGILERDENGQTVVRKTGQQGSGLLHSMAAANCFIVLPLENSGVQPGDRVDVQIFHGIV